MTNLGYKERELGPYEKGFKHEGRQYYVIFNLIYDAAEVLAIDLVAVYWDQEPEVDLQDQQLLGMGLQTAKSVADILHKKALA